MNDEAEWRDEELNVELEIDAELAFEDAFPLRLVEGEDDRFATGLRRDPGRYSAEELAIHLI